MNLHRMLCERAAAGRPLCVALIGAGKFGAMYLAQPRHTPGIHVLGIAGLAPDRETMRAAAAVAAWHSKARRGGQVAVSCTQARYVSKPHGAPPGTVRIRKEGILRVRPALPRGFPEE